MSSTPPSSTADVHATHDLTIVAALAARATDLDASTAQLARAQVASCTGCADLLADLVALQTTLPVASTPARPRDFRLSAADAARLHRSGWRRLLGFFGSARDGISRPLAIGFTTLGLAGILVASVPSMFLASGAAGGAATEMETLSNVGAPVQPAPSAGEAYSSDRMSIGAAAGGEPVETGVFSGGEPDEVSRDVTGDDGLLAITEDTSRVSTLFVVAGVLLIAGLGLFGLRWSARRLL